MGYTSPGYCNILTDDEGTVTLPYGLHEGLAEARCLSEGVYEVDGLRFCQPHVINAIDLTLIEDRNARVSYVGE